MCPNGDTYPNYFPEKEALWQGTDGLIQSLKDHPATYSVWAKLYRKKLVEDVRFVVGRRVHEDSFFVFQCLMKQPIVTVADHVVLQYRISENSVSRSAFSEKLFDILAFAKDKTELIQTHYPELMGLSKNLWIKANMALLHNLCKTTDPKYRKTEKDCIRAILKDKKYFIPAIPSDKKWFWIIRCRLYPVYKKYYQMR